MKMNNKYILILFFMFIPLLLCACGGDDVIESTPDPNPKPDPKPEFEFNYVFKQNTDGYEVYRIPAIVNTKGNVLLAFAEARKLRSNGDSGDIDLVVKRSTDNGKTWSKQIMIWNDAANSCGNPVPIVDDKGRVHMLMTWNHGEDKWGSLINGTGKDKRRLYYTYSDDEGANWSEPIEITSAIKESSWDWYGSGPVHGIQIKKGLYKGRLVAPNYFTKRISGKVVEYSHVIYSDDYGVTWKSGNPPTEGNVGECSVAELPDGKLMLNMRTSDGFFRKYSISEDGGLNWSIPVIASDQLDAKCQGSILIIGNTLLLSNASAATRTNMTIRKSLNQGATWIGKYVVYTGNSGYSDMVEISENEVAVFYEGGKNRYTEGLDFKIIDFSLIK